MKRLRLCLGLLAVCLCLTASVAKARPFLPFCQDVCCNGLGTPTTPCIGLGGITATCGPPYSYFCPFA